MIKNFDDFQKLGQQNVDTAMKMFGEWSKGWQAIAAEMTDYTKRSFEEGTARLRPDSYVPLDSIADILLADSTIRVEIAAHTDNSMPRAAAQHLTNLQADAVRTYLVTRGVRFQQVIPQGYGATVPLTQDNTPRGRLANRRVEIRPAAPGP